MNIFGIGTDIVNIKRMENSLKKYGIKFKNKIFSNLKSLQKNNFLQICFW